MKKIIFILSMVFAFTLNANAQEASKTARENARTEAVMVSETVGLNATQTEDFYRLFEMKYQTLEDTNVPYERKKEFLKVVLAKIEATLDGNQMKKLEANTELMDRIKNGVKTK